MRSIDATARRIRALVMRRGLSANDADEVAQEAFLRLEEARRSEEIAAPEGFVVRVALNLAADIVRRHARWRFEPVPVEEMDLHDPAPTPDDVIGARKRLDRVRAALDALPEEIRTVIVLKRLEGLTIEQIAKRENVGTATVERRLRRGLTLLAEMDTE
ncbi:RNA polymerase sigma factor [Sphingomonas sp. BT-65]|uniref:RNA polymerase sigma factor n=1 Tax=Sphingomonas sp. BT-65 TaxID=2989821 RepID=UPI002235D670|nr:RNA polymerase sigma factor [Sphingomonas sp. BT-65]MCW4460671.1 RNA polymerase sigma factor [Sphingomonas sp. BT-65]